MNGRQREADSGNAGCLRERASRIHITASTASHEHAGPVNLRQGQLDWCIDACVHIGRLRECVIGLIEPAGGHESETERPHGAGPIEQPYGHSFTGPSLPLMLIHGTADPFAPSQSSVDEFKRAPGPKYLVTLVGAKHIAFDEPWETVAVRAMIDFFDHSLKHEERALHQLRKDATVPRVARLRAVPR
jgi:pimeloyl-ACP methyl ester carboxylesterase